MTVPPPQQEPPRQTTRLAQIVPMEVLDNGGVQDEEVGDPGALLRTVSLPVDEVLKTPTLMVHIQYLLEGVSLVIIDDPGGWRGISWRAQRTDRQRF